ncbi:MAG: Gfo/Idh/MocA family oxidoreductase [Oscillospiraceae bacterium]|nr:Gfo/Idh/MocA family oxidoreductase [Oscillospiraceae bacterium]
MERKGLRWGILGTGGIANQFARTVLSVEGAELAAVGSRAAETAEAFGEKWGVPAARRFGSYAELAACPDVDIVYVASPHSHHAEHALQMLAGGKHVLVEKAFTLNAAEAEAVFAEGRRRGLFVCEAIWTRFLPANRQLAAFLEEGELGAPRMASAMFGNHFPDDMPLTHRIYAPALGGGALLDRGVSPMSWLSMIARDETPETVRTTGRLFAPTGCDESSTVVCGYGSGLTAVSSCSIKVNYPDEGVICCERGRVRAPSFWRAEGFSVWYDDGREREFRPGCDRLGLRYELISVTEDILAGRTASRVVPPSATLCVQRILEAARLSLGFRYDREKTEKEEENAKA